MAGAPVTEADFLQPGKQQVAAGYAVYGPQTMLVLTIGNGVVGFTLDREMGSWVLTHEDICVPEDARIRDQHVEHAPLGPAGQALHRRLSGRQDRSAGQGLQHALDRLDGGRRASHPDPWRHLHVSLDAREPGKAGKLRLMYEANPMSFLIEQAGGASINGTQRILDIQPDQLHQRVSVILGSKNEVERVGRYHAEDAAQG